MAEVGPDAAITTDATADAIIAETKQEVVIDPAQAKARLEKSLGQRPDKNELVDRNILKSSNAAPALQAAQSKLERSQLEDKLDRALQQRPNADELVKDGILKESETA